MKCVNDVILFKSYVTLNLIRVLNFALLKAYKN